MSYEIAAAEEVSTAVVQAVSDHEHRQPTSLPPLCQVIDPEALNGLFSAPSDADTTRSGVVSFVYSHTCVTVHHSEYITVESITDPRPTPSADK
jgi:hypothetical protein